MTVKVYFYRPGDAEYTFNTNITNIKGQIIDVVIPDKFTRGKEVRHPNINVIIQCIISYVTEPILNDEAVEFNGTMFKLNIDEAILRLEKKLDYNIDYYLRFEIWNFKIKIISSVIADRTIKEENVFYYTFKFKEMSNPAMEVLHKYIMEHLS